jgi:hypothetical protein
MVRPQASVTSLLGTIALVLSLLAPSAASAFCGCRTPRVPRCDGADTKHRITVHVDLMVADGAIEILTQSGPYRMPPAHVDGKPILAAFMPRGEIFQGFLDEAVTIAGGIMTGTQAVVETTAAFAPGEYEVLLFIDAVADGGLGPQRGDLAAFDNSGCDPTGVSVRVAVGCEDVTVDLENRHFIIF